MKTLPIKKNLQDSSKESTPSRRRQISRILSADVRTIGLKRSLHVDDAAAIRRCRHRYKIKKKKPWRRPHCKKQLCPGCRAVVAKRDCSVLLDQFTDFDPGWLHEIRITLPARCLRGKRYEIGLKRFRIALKRILDSPEWEQAFLRSGGAIHTPWVVMKQREREGYGVHVHLLCAARETPSWRALGRVLRRWLGFPVKRTRRFFRHRACRNLYGYVRYMTHVRNLIPGYPRKKDLGIKGTKAWRLPRVGDEDIEAFKRVRLHRRRLILRRPDKYIEALSRRTTHQSKMAKKAWGTP